jgi:hypothetical protein
VRGGLLAVGFLPKARMDRMGMPGDLFTTREPDALTSVAIEGRIHRGYALARRLGALEGYALSKG